MNGGVGRGIAGGTLPGSAWEKLGTPVGIRSVHPTPQTLQGILSAVSQGSGIPSGGLWGAVVYVHQPLDSLHALPHVGHDSDSGGM